MFNLKEFITRNIVNGIKNGTFTKEYGSILAVNYLAKGILGEADLVSIDEKISEWEATQITIENEQEDFVEEVTEETIE
jgi:hypothetical protein